LHIRPGSFGSTTFRFVSMPNTKYFFVLLHRVVEDPALWRDDALLTRETHPACQIFSECSVKSAPCSSSFLRCKISFRHTLYLYLMESSVLKKYLLEIAEKLTPESTIEDVYQHLSMLADIDESEDQEKKGEVFTQNQVREASGKWLK